MCFGFCSWSFTLEFSVPLVSPLTNTDPSLWPRTPWTSAYEAQTSGPGISTSGFPFSGSSVVSHSSCSIVDFHSSGSALFIHPTDSTLGFSSTISFLGVYSYDAVVSPSSSARLFSSTSWSTVIISSTVFSISLTMFVRSSYDITENFIFSRKK